MTQEYLLGDASPEAQRLASQHRAWLEITLRSFRRAGLRAGDCVLDMGAGPGLATRELAFEVGSEGRVLAVDQSEVFATELADLAAALPQVEVHRAALEALEVPTQSLDAIYARWVFCFLQDPGAVIRRLADALKPGGRWVVLDYFNYRAFALAPRSAAMEPVVEAIAQSWKAHDGSLDVAGDIPTLMTDAGLVVETVDQASPLVRPGDPLWNWPRSFLASYLPSLVAAGLLSESQVGAFWIDWSDREARGGSFLYLPPVIEIIARKP